VNSRACSRHATLVEAGEAHLRHPASRGEMLTRRVLDVSVGDCALQRHIDLAQRRKKFCCWGDPDTNNCRKHHNGSSQASAKMKSITACAVRGHRNLS
jgi:hypothetical protein